MFAERNRWSRGDTATVLHPITTAHIAIARRDLQGADPGIGPRHAAQARYSFSSNYFPTIGRPRQLSLRENEMGISELVPQVPRPDRFRIGVTDAFDP